MRQLVAVVNSDKEDCQRVCAFLAQRSYRAIPLHSLNHLERETQGGGYRVVIVDLDTLPVDNRLFREIKKSNPRTRIIGLSGRPFHPDLEEAFSAHISVCLAKPVDWDELMYWLRSLGENERSPRDSPTA
jgi:DNA-binding response OmpR family regulator